MTGMTEDGLFIGLLVLGMFMFMFAQKRRNVLVSLGTFIIWFALGVWLFFSASAPIGFGETWKDVLGWGFLVLSLMPLVFHMDVEIQHEKAGKRYTKYGAEPQEKGPNGYEVYRDKLYGRTRR